MCTKTYFCSDLIMIDCELCSLLCCLKSLSLGQDGGISQWKESQQSNGAWFRCFDAMSCTSKFNGNNSDGNKLTAKLMKTFS